jgi:hypothetical protein
MRDGSWNGAVRRQLTQLGHAIHNFGASPGIKSPARQDPGAGPAAQRVRLPAQDRVVPRALPLRFVAAPVLDGSQARCTAFPSRCDLPDAS